MPLPIPDIMQNAANALKEAKDVCRNIQNTDTDALEAALKKINPDDLLAVLNEIGRVYQGVNNMKVLQIGSKPNPSTRQVEIVVQVEFGFGPQVLFAGLPVENAMEFVKAIGKDIQAVNPKKLILNA